MTAMKNSISDVLETMFFMPLDYPDTGTIEDLWRPEYSEILTGKLDFKGPFSGYLIFFIPKEMAASLAARFLGMDEGKVSQENVNETVKEIVNMIAGGTFSHYDESEVFHLGIPEFVDPDSVRDHDPDLENVIFIPIDTLEDRIGLMMVIGN
jgi:CheY-specific phosphatase CheX